MTRNEYIDYWVTWLERTEPGVNVTADVAAGVVVMIRDGDRFTGFPIVCNCLRLDCLGWAMVTVKEKYELPNVRVR